MAQIAITTYQSQFAAWQLSRRVAADSSDLLGFTLVDAQVDLNAHQVEAALFAFQSTLSKGAILDRQDEIDLERSILISALEEPLAAVSTSAQVFTIAWQLQ